jgi:hypothetical protein
VGEKSVINSNELKRLHEAAKWQGQKPCAIEDNDEYMNVMVSRHQEKELLLCHVPEILAALEDRERLDKLEQLMLAEFDVCLDANTNPGMSYFFIQHEGMGGCDEVYRGDGNLRAAIDAARGKKP